MCAKQFILVSDIEESFSIKLWSENLPMLLKTRSQNMLAAKNTFQQIEWLAKSWSSFSFKTCLSKTMKLCAGVSPIGEYGELPPTLFLTHFDPLLLPFKQLIWILNSALPVHVIVTCITLIKSSMHCVKVFHLTSDRYHTPGLKTWEHPSERFWWRW